MLALLVIARSPAATVGSIHGTAVDTAAHRPLAGVRIELVAPSGKYTALTDAHGFYSIVGIIPDTYALDASVKGYRSFHEDGITITQDTNLSIDVALQPQTLREIGHVIAHSASFPVQPHQPIDVYVVTPHEQSQLGGIPAFDNEAQLLNTLPGATLVGGASGSGLVGGFAAIRGGLANQIGYQLDGVDATDPVTLIAFNKMPPAGRYTLTVTYSQNGKKTTRTASADFRRAMLPSFSGVTAHSDHKGGAAVSLRFPHGVTQVLANIIDANVPPAPSSKPCSTGLGFATLLFEGTGTQRVPDNLGNYGKGGAKTFCKGDLLNLQVIGFDYDDFHLGPPGNTQQRPHLPGRADMTYATVVIAE